MLSHCRWIPISYLWFTAADDYLTAVSFLKWRVCHGINELLCFCVVKSGGNAAPTQDLRGVSSVRLFSNLHYRPKMWTQDQICTKKSLPNGSQTQRLTSKLHDAILSYDEIFVVSTDPVDGCSDLRNKKKSSKEKWSCSKESVHIFL